MIASPTGSSIASGGGGLLQDLSSNNVTLNNALGVLNQSIRYVGTFITLNIV